MMAQIMTDTKKPTQLKCRWPHCEETEGAFIAHDGAWGVPAGVYCLEHWQWEIDPILDEEGVP